MKRYLLAATTAAIFLSSCNHDSARLTGRFMDCGNKPVYLEMVTPGRTATVDSTVTSPKGEFKFKVNIADRSATIFNIKTSDELIPLILSPGEKVRINSVGNLSQNYTVEGSRESELVESLNSMLTEGTRELATISKRYMDEPSAEGRKTISQEYIKKYYGIKRSHIGFLVNNAASLAGLYGLYQRLPGDEFLFNGQNDIIYYRMIADSVSRTYPDSKYLVALQRDIREYDNTHRIKTDIAEQASSPVGFPPLELPNMYGQKISLSEVVSSNKATLVCFWSAELENASILNAELKTIYDSYKDKGFEIYQISIDTSKPLWVNSVQAQKLPWISLCDFRGAASPAPVLYNIKSVPSDFLINAQGDIVAKHVFGRQLVDKLNEILN